MPPKAQNLMSTYKTGHPVNLENLDMWIKEIYDRVIHLETENANLKAEINQLKSGNNNNGESRDSTNIRNWVTVVTGNKKKPQEQLVVVNAAINEQLERKKREKNIVIYGLTESTKATPVERVDEDKEKVKNIFENIGKAEEKVVSLRRLRSRNANKPGPVIIELEDSSKRNPLLLAAKNLRDKQNFNGIYLGPDMTEAERLLDYELRKKRNELNAELDENSPFRYAIRGNQIRKFKKQTN